MSGLLRIKMISAKVQNIDEVMLVTIFNIGILWVVENGVIGGV